MMNEGRYEATFLREGYSLNAPRNAELWGEYNYTVKDNGMALVPVYGPLGCVTSYASITGQIENALKDDDVKEIVLLINSPGGSVAGMFDTCRYIAEASKKKRCTAYVTGMACSAAYAIASSCSAIYLREDAEVGSCGCYAHAIEASEEYYKKQGFLSRIFRSKVSPKKNCSVITNEEEAKAYQEEIDNLGEKYLRYVSENRNVPYEDALVSFGQGGVLMGENALKVGMADGICTLEELGEKLTSQGENIDCSQNGSEGEEMDIVAMSTEERVELFSNLCSQEPSFIEEKIKEAKREERERILSLNALRNGSDSVDTIVNKAVEEGLSPDAIALDLVKAMKEEANEKKVEAMKILESFADETTDVDAKRETGKEVNPYIAAAETRNKEE